MIRPPTSADCAAFIAAVDRSRELHGPWVAPKASNQGEFEAYLQRFDSNRNHGFLVIHRPSGDLVGVININEVIRGAFQSGAIGYYAFEPHAGKGLMRKALLLVLKHAFGKLKLHRVEANIQPGNRASLALVQKFGFVREGLSKRMLKLKGRWKDHERWALLAEDFARQRR